MPTLRPIPGRQPDLATQDGTPPELSPYAGPTPYVGPTPYDEPTDALVLTRGLAKRYGTVEALAGVDLSLAPGHIVGLLGENGCGKTTLLKTLAGVVSDYTGEVTIAGHRLGPESKARVSFLPDTSFLRDGWTVARCLRLYGDFFADFDESAARAKLDLFGLRDDLKLSQASKGMREKVQIALAMARRAQVYLLDEPISGVDPAARDILLNAIVSDLREDALVLVSTHLVHDLEPVLDSVVIMRHGRIVLAGDLDDLRAERGADLDTIFREMHR